MPLWHIAPVAEQPSCTLSSWLVFETERGERHLCGYAMQYREGRVSSAVQRFDPLTAVATTSSGRAYKLAGRPGANADAQYVLNSWLRRNSVESYNDVSDEVWKSIQGSATPAGGPAA